MQTRARAARLEGVRVSYDEAPDRVKAWAEQTLGAEVVGVRHRVGGMSPAIAASLRGANGRTMFVKAVSSEINPDTPTHFRHEIEVLTALPAAPYRARLLSTYDDRDSDGGWVAIALEDVEGDHPDWSSPTDRATVLEAVQRQTAELTPVPAGLPLDSNRVAIAKYLETMADPTADELAGLPRWAVDELPALLALGRGCLDDQRDESFCHWDLRHDNILIRHRDHQPLLLDWGMSRRGQRWGDTVVLALEWVDSPAFDDMVGTVGPTPQEAAAITGFIAAAGCFLLMAATRPPPPALPNLPAFRRQVGTACLRGVRRRLDG